MVSCKGVQFCQLHVTLTKIEIRLPAYLSSASLVQNSPNNRIEDMAPSNKNASHEEIWDDSALVDSWNDALEEYKVRRSREPRASITAIADVWSEIS
jgi:hypothetical protein